MVSIEKIHRIAGSRPGESVLRVIHRHWFDIATHLLAPVTFGAALLVALILFPALSPTLASGDTGELMLLIGSTVAILTWINFFLVWIDVWFDVWIVTNQRIINIEQRGLFVRHVSEISFSKVQDVTSEIDGFLPSILNYGEVFVQSAGEVPRFIFRNIPDPVAVKDLVMRLAQGAKEDDLEDAVDILEEMRRHKRA